MARYFPNTLLDFQGGTVSTCPSTLRGYLRETLTYVLGGQGSRHRFSVYTGEANGHGPLSCTSSSAAPRYSLIRDASPLLLHLQARRGWPTPAGTCTGTLPPWGM